METQSTIQSESFALESQVIETITDVDPSDAPAAEPQEVPARDYAFWVPKGPADYSDGPLKQFKKLERGRSKETAKAKHVRELRLRDERVRLGFLAREDAKDRVIGHTVSKLVRVKC